MILRVRLQQLDCRGRGGADGKGGIRGWRHPQSEMPLLPGPFAGSSFTAGAGAVGRVVGSSPESRASLPPHSRLPAASPPPRAQVKVVATPTSEGYCADSVKLCIKP